MELLDIVTAILSFLAGSGLFKILGERTKKVLQQYSEDAADGLGRAKKLVDDYKDGKISRVEVERQMDELETFGGWIKEQLPKNKKKSGGSAKVLFLLAPVMALLLSTGCGAYTEHIAPKIPAISLEGSIGGEGVGASVGFTSKWTGEKRKRSIDVEPELDAGD